MITPIYLKNVTTLKLDRDKCSGCGMCLNVCPHEVFILRETKAFIRDRDACMECGACALNCPEAAIAVDAGVGCAAAVITSFFKGGRVECGCSDESAPQASCGGGGSRTKEPAPVSIQKKASGCGCGGAGKPETASQKDLSTPCCGTAADEPDPHSEYCAPAPEEKPVTKSCCGSGKAASKNPPCCG